MVKLMSGGLGCRGLGIYRWAPGITTKTTTKPLRMAEDNLRIHRMLNIPGVDFRGHILSDFTLLILFSIIRVRVNKVVQNQRTYINYLRNSIAQEHL